MIKLLIIADDFTGALDTGVQFAKEGIRTGVGMEFDEKLLRDSGEDSVLVIDAETRPMTPAQAYERVAGIVENADAAGIRYVFKKTDSALRGNIGCELSAVLNAGGEKILNYVPAFPKIGRTTVDGIHYIDGIPVNESVFGKDPFEPVSDANIKNIIGSQSDIRVLSLPKEQEEYYEVLASDGACIAVYDAKTDEEMYQIGAKLKAENRLGLMAGCAGFASQLPGLLGLKGHQENHISKRKSMIVISGSLNPITENQIEFAQSSGFQRITLNVESMMQNEYWNTEEGRRKLEDLAAASKENSMLIIDTFSRRYEDSIHTVQTENAHGNPRFRIAALLGEMTDLLLEKGISETHALVMTGGDTVMGFMKRHLGLALTPVCEIGQGAVLSYLNRDKEILPLITKSGGFGEDNIFLTIAGQLLLEK